MLKHIEEIEDSPDIEEISKQNNTKIGYDTEDDCELSGEELEEMSQVFSELLDIMESGEDL